jgi:hypothetical protein
MQQGTGIHSHDRDMMRSSHRTRQLSWSEKKEFGSREHVIPSEGPRGGFPCSGAAVPVQVESYVASRGGLQVGILSSWCQRRSGRQTGVKVAILHPPSVGGVFANTDSVT